MVIRVTATGAKPEPRQESTAVNTPFRLFEDFFNNWALRTLENRREAPRPPVDVLEANNNLIIRMEIPGMSEKGFDLKVDGRTLTVRGERIPEPEDSGYVYHQVEGYYGAFARSFDLPDSVDIAKIAAGYTDGVLKITIPQKPESHPRTIKVNA